MRTAYLTVAALLCSLAAAPADDEKQQEAAVVKFIESAPGGGFVRDDSLEGKPIYWVQVQAITDADLAKLKPLVGLRHLLLLRTRVTDAGLK